MHENRKVDSREETLAQRREDEIQVGQGGDAATHGDQHLSAAQPCELLATAVSHFGGVRPLV